MKEYNIFFLEELSFDALKQIKALKPSQPLILNFDEKQDRVQVVQKTKTCTLGYLSQNDSRGYIPYLKKGHNELYESIIFQVRECDEPSKMIQIAIRISDNNQQTK